MRHIKKIMKKWGLLQKWLLLNFRRIFLRLRGMKIRCDTLIYGHVSIVGDPKNITIGHNLHLNPGVHLNAGEKIIIGNNVTLSAYVQIYTLKYQMDRLPRKHIKQPVIIEDNVWIAAGTVISAGVTIHKNCVVGANSLVTHDLDPNCFYSGVPAQKIKKISYASTKK